MQKHQQLKSPIFANSVKNIRDLKYKGPLFVTGDSRKTLHSLPSNFFQCCVTSPPYWGLRNYEAPDQIGLELDPNDYVADLVEVFAEVRRTLRDDGVLWLNIGDSYTSGNRKYRDSDKKLPQRGMGFRAPTPNGWKDKELVGIPWMLAKGLQGNGWYLRSDIVWYKPNCMPESVKDRVTRSHEYVFMLTKSERYFYDYAAAKEPNGRNWRTVWSINTEACSVAHFATYPKELVQRCLTAATRPDDWVLDPFAGSGTTAIVADLMGRKSIGIELNSDYRKIIESRFELERSKGVRRESERVPKEQGSLPLDI